jgi:hypothetical protein
MENILLERKSIIGIICILLMPYSTKSQELPDKLNINIQSNFFITNGDYDRFYTYFNPINPGGEILYEMGLSKNVSLSAGVNYIYSEYYNSIGEKSHFKRQAHELFIPILFNTKLSNKIYIMTGIYSGWLAKGKLLYKNEMGIRDWIDHTKHSNYDSSQKFSADIFLGVGYILPLNSRHSIHFSPFVKFKITDNWMGEVRNRTSFGIKVNYAFEV